MEGWLIGLVPGNVLLPEGGLLPGKALVGSVDCRSGVMGAGRLAGRVERSPRQSLYWACSGLIGSKLRASRRPVIAVVDKAMKLLVGSIEMEDATIEQDDVMVKVWGVGTWAHRSTKRCSRLSM